MYFNNHMFNTQYVNPDYYRLVLEQNRYSQEQDKKVLDAVKAIHDLCDAIKGMDEAHQQTAFYACLAEMGCCLNW